MIEILCEKYSRFTKGFYVERVENCHAMLVGETCTAAQSAIGISYSFETPKNAIEKSGSKNRSKNSSEAGSKFLREKNGIQVTYTLISNMYIRGGHAARNCSS